MGEAQDRVTRVEVEGEGKGEGVENSLARFFPRSGESRDNVLSADASGLTSPAIVGTVLVKMWNDVCNSRSVIDLMG
jgi:hypothetical protein